MAGRTMVIFDFDNSDAARDWFPVDDVVMGGLSSSDLVVEGPGVGVFGGVVSVENYGGFASVRSHNQRLDLGEFDGLALRVLGDGKRYLLRLRPDPYMEGVAYEATFTPQANSWVIVRLPFADFRPTFRGRLIVDAPPLNPGHIYSFGIMISEKQAGPFCLQIDWIAAYAEMPAGPG